jgi:hypothetical protein
MQAEIFTEDEPITAILLKESYFFQQWKLSTD